jgi:hypothetical protein
MKAITFFSACLLIVCLYSCGGRNAAPQDSMYRTLESADTAHSYSAEDNSSKIPVAADSSGSVPLAIAKNIHQDWDKKIIKTADLNLEIKDYKSFNDNIHTTIHNYGGYVAQEEQTQYDDRLETVMSIKVPVDQFDVLMNQLASTDDKVLQKKITSQDVTDEAVDTKSRLEAKKQMRLKYFDFLKQSKNMEEALQVQKEINDLQAEIESAAQRSSYLSHASAFSTINLTFYQPLKDVVPAEAPQTFLSRTGDSFHSGAAWIENVFVGLISVWPLFLVLFIGFIVYKKAVPSNKNKQQNL